MSNGENVLFSISALNYTSSTDSRIFCFPSWSSLIPVFDVFDVLTSVSLSANPLSMMSLFLLETIRA